MNCSFKHTGDFSKTLRFLNSITKKEYLNPKDTGNTAAAWDFVIEVQNGRTSISWINKNVNDGVNIALILNYGHGTGFGTYVQGRQYISPAIRPIFDKIADDVWKEVKSL